MKRYMVIYVEDGTQRMIATESLSEAREFHFGITCGIGVYCEVYERMYDEEEGYEYHLLFA